ncbi:MAG: NAD(P)H-dependent oxidoreductase [Anaerolineae bacterium]|jgi:multimeric flavodoxin WrbA|nr:NAD(P)H-dependent oxidoreductase [Anaerolineae bacterium]
MKHVVAINGSPRKANTTLLLNRIGGVLAKHGIKTTVLSLSDYRIMECIGCETCIRKTGKCFQDDATEAVLSQLRNADGIILSSPVYLMQITSSMKRMIDKTPSWTHRPPLVGKPVLLASTTAGSGLKDVLRYLETVAIQWGGFPTGFVGRSATNQSPVTEDDLKRFIWHMTNSREKFSPSYKQLTQYQVQRALSQNVLDIDKQFWAKKGWDKQIYYFNCRIDPIKRMWSSIFFSVLNSRMKRSPQR